MRQRRMARAKAGKPAPAPGREVHQSLARLAEGIAWFRKDTAKGLLVAQLSLGVRDELGRGGWWGHCKPPGGAPTGRLTRNPNS